MLFDFLIIFYILVNKFFLSMKIKELFKDINYTIIQGNEEIDIKDIENNNNKIQDKEDALFICIVGAKFDGHNFINTLGNNVKAILVEKDIKTNDNKTIVKVENTREVMNKICFNFYGNPQNKIKVVGVTGTSGKTSTTIITETILKHLDKKVAVLGTLGYRIGENQIPLKGTTITTPDSLELARMFDYIVKNNVDYVVMETTSHSLALNRVDSIKFEVGIFTNLGIEHLDFHKTIEGYAKAKYKLFELSNNCVFNIDDEHGLEFYKKTNKNKLSTSLQNENADLYGYNVNTTPNGTFFDLKYKNKEYKNNFINLVGIFSVYNTLGAISACLLLDYNIDEVLKSLNNISYIAGRCESVNNNKVINIIIDYAHTAEQFDNILKAIKKFTKGKLISLFGCGGDRDNSKRPLMGEVAGKLSDYVVVAEDNPRSEDPNEINKQIEIGIKRTSTPYKLFVNRKEAIEYALSIAKEGDTFIMLGKGPERYQEYKNGEKPYFCEREVVENYLKSN